MFVIQPYWHAGTWVFDDERVGLDKEPFVAGVPEIIDQAIKKAGLSKTKLKKGFRLLFSHLPFPDHQIKLEHESEEGGGNWYNENQLELRGWLCPALFKYFAKAPKELYGKVEVLEK